MKTQTVNCLNCSKVFEASIKEINRGNGKFCTRSCSISFNAKERVKKFNTPNVSCSNCGKMFYKSPSKKSASKSGLYFCNRSCKDQAQKLGGLKEIMPPHYGRGKGKHNYRQLALDHYGLKCQECGFDKHPEVLTAHHKDLNHSNNELSNLVVLCANCHYLFHWSKTPLKCLK